MAPVRLIDLHSVSAPFIRKPVRDGTAHVMKEAGRGGMLDNPAIRSDKLDRQNAQIALIGPRFGQMTQAPPCTARGMSDQGSVAQPKPGIAGNIPAVSAQRAINAVGSRKKDWDHLAAVEFGQHNVRKRGPFVAFGAPARLLIKPGLE